MDGYVLLRKSTVLAVLAPSAISEDSGGNEPGLQPPGFIDECIDLDKSPWFTQIHQVMTGGGQRVGALPVLCVVPGVVEWHGNLTQHRAPQLISQSHKPSAGLPASAQPLILSRIGEMRFVF